MRYICLFLFTKLFCRQDGGIAFLPHPFRFSDTSANNHSIVGSASHCNRSSPLHKGAKGDTALSTFPKPHYPFALHHILASLVKGRWIDGKAQTVSLLRFTCDISVFFLFTKLFCRQDGGIAFLPHPFRFSDTSANNHSIVGSASHCNRSSPLHKGAKSDTALPTIFQNLTTPIQNHCHWQSTDACNGRTKSLCTDAYSQPYQVTARCSDKKWLTMHGRI